MDETLTLDLHFGEFEAFLYSPTNEFLGVVRNEVILLGFLAKVATENRDGYYLIYNGQRYDIDNHGRIRTYFPIKFVDECLRKIVGF